MAQETETGTATETRAEAMLRGLDQIREGLALVATSGGNRDDLLRLMVGSQGTVRRFREALSGEPLLRNLVYSLVAARVTRPGEDSVRRVLDTFFAVVFELAAPYEPAGKAAE